MPSKSLLAVADIALPCKHAQQYGLDACDVRAELATVMDRKDRHVGRFERALQEKLSEDGYDILEGSAFFTDERTIKVSTEDETHTIQASRFVLATGSRPSVPPVDGLDSVSYLTSDSIMEGELSETPSRVAVLGGGSIGLELATFFAGMGSDVSVIEMNSLVKEFGDTTSTEYKNALEHNGITVYDNAKAETISPDGGGLQITAKTLDGTKHINADRLVVATGREPALEDLGLSEIGVEDREFTVADDTLVLSGAERVFAAGDVTGRYQLLHVASEEGRIAGKNAAAGSATHSVDREKLNMSVIFSHPPIAHVGMTEPEAENAGAITERVHLPETGRAITMGVQYGCWSLSVDPKTGKILGSTIVGPRADDLIHEVFFAMRLGAHISDIAGLYGYHPTLTEQFVSLANTLTERINT